jgi:hypothetical protein
MAKKDGRRVVEERIHEDAAKGYVGTTPVEPVPNEH